ncbi:MAG TPA: hypothetical protein VJ183_07890 [Chloroflexia bacterium]|nr:hypothetical protein [Chloroflexia bacterium]
MVDNSWNRRAITTLRVVGSLILVLSMLLAFIEGFRFFSGTDNYYYYETLYSSRWNDWSHMAAAVVILLFGLFVWAVCMVLALMGESLLEIRLNTAPPIQDNDAYDESASEEEPADEDA